jgi:hypothetical protein
MINHDDNDQQFLVELEKFVRDSRIVSIIKVEDGKILVVTEDKAMQKHHVDRDLHDLISKLNGETDDESIE